MRDGLGRIETVALVGAGAEIGLASTRGLRQIGPRRFVLAGRPSERRTAAEAELGPEARAVDMDLADLGSPDTAVDRLFEVDIDVLRLAAGVLTSNPSRKRPSTWLR